MKGQGILTMDAIKTDIKELTNNPEIYETSIRMAYEAFPEASIGYALNDSFNKQLNEAPMLVLIYCAAVRSYSQNNKIINEPQDFPDLIKLWNEETERALYFQAQVNSANEEYNMKSDISGGAGLKRLLKYVDDGYKKNPYSDHIKMIATYGLTWKEKSFEERQTKIIQKEQSLPKINLSDKLTTMAAERYGKFIGDNYVFFDELMQNPALTIAMAEYKQIYEYQKPKQPKPSLMDMLENQDIINLSEGIKNPKEMADKIPDFQDKTDPYDALPALLNEVRENPQKFFTNEGFINTTEYDKQQLALQEKKRSGDYING